MDEVEFEISGPGLGQLLQVLAREEKQEWKTDVVDLEDAVWGDPGVGWGVEVDAVDGYWGC